MNQTPKRIVIIEGDAFDADAIVAIIKTDDPDIFSVFIKGVDAGFDYEFDDSTTLETAMILAIAAWRREVDAVVPPVPTPQPPPSYEPLPDQPEPEPTYWSDEKGRYFETYGGSPIHRSPTTGESLIWNAGPPGRANIVGPGASPIVKVYIDQEGKPLDPQPL